MDAAVNAAKMFELSKQRNLAIWDGKYREARNIQREFAKIAVKDFETCKTLPNIHFNNAPLSVVLVALGRSIVYRIFKAFTKQTPEEKELAKKYTEYQKQLTPEDKKKNTINITIPTLYP